MRYKDKQLNHPVILLFGIVLIAVLTGFGNMYASTVDWLGQHSVFPEVFRNNFYKTGNLVPNFLFELGAGQNVFNFIYYGFLSPVILISYFLPFVNMTYYIIGASVVLYLLTGILTEVFIKIHFGEKLALFAALFMLAAPGISFHFHRHIMFVWYLPFLLISLIGLDRFFEKGKAGLFIVSTFCIILTSYMFSVGCLVCLFVYAIYRILDENGSDFKLFLKKFFHTVFIFVIPILMAAFVLLPTMYTLFSNTRPDSFNEKIVTLFVPAMEEYAYRHYSMGITGGMIAATFGMLFCGTSKKSDRFLSAVLICLIIFPVITYAFNGFLYVRGKMLIPFTILYVFNFFKFLEKLKHNRINVKFVGYTVIIFSVALFAVNSLKYLYVYAFIIIEMLAMIFSRNKVKVMLVLMCVFVLGAVFKSNKAETYISFDYQAEMYHNEIEEMLDNTDIKGFYRTNLSYREGDNANRLYTRRHNNTSLYSSTTNREYMDFYFNNTGNNVKRPNLLEVAGASNELFHTFMGTRYIVSERDPGFFYDEIDDSGVLKLYENESCYPVVYKSRNLMSQDEFDKSGFPYSMMYLLSNTVVQNTDSKAVVPEISEIKVNTSYKFENEETVTYAHKLSDEYLGKIMYISFDIHNEGEYLNDENISISLDGCENLLSKHNWIYYNGNTTFQYVIPMENDTIIDVEISPGKFDIRNVRVYTSEIMYETYDEADNLVIDQKNSRINCSVEASKGEYLVTSIPFDKGFKAFVNGEETDIEEVNKAFLGLKLKDGKNDIVIEYTSPFLDVGIIISLIGLIMFLFELVGKKILLKLIEKNREVVMYLIVGALTTLISIVTYYLCTNFVFDPKYAVNIQISAVISWIISVTFAYITNKTIVFNSKNSAVGEVWKFFSSRLGTLLIDMLLMFVLASVLKFNDMIVKIFVEIIVIVLNYIFSKFLVFKKKNIEQ